MDTLQRVLVAIAVVVFTFANPFALRFYFWFISERSLRKGASSRQSKTLKMEDYFTRRQQPDDKTFDRFTDLGEDIMTHILSFVAEAPFELHNVNYMSALTHSLPLVSKQFHRLTNTDDLWKAALIRQTKREPGLWNEGLRKMLRDAQNGDGNNNEEEPENIINQLLQQDEGSTTCAELYKTVLNTIIRFKGPIFCMPQQIKLGGITGLHFFEPRYRRLIAEIMAPFPEAARRGESIETAPGQAPPVFIHANHPSARVERGTPACLVQVIRCRIYPDGRADVFLLPIAFVHMELVWEIPNSGHLYFGQCIRMGRAESEQLNNAMARRSYSRF